MFTRFDATKSTKGASKMRRDLINAEIANLRDLLPLPPSTRQRLSQLQLMALVCVYVRKANYFQQVFKRHDVALHHLPTPNIGFSKALSGFLMMMTQNGKLLYISDNAAEYLGHSMEDLLIHGDSVYDIIDKQDHQAIQTELVRNATGPSEDDRMFLCRMNVSRNARRQMRFGDQKVVLVQGHYLSFLPLCSRNEPVFLATCTPVAMPETRECVVQGATNVFTSIHSMDMKFMHIDKNGEFHLEYPRNELQGISWYHLLHWDCMKEAQSKHRLITQSEQDRSCILLLRLQKRCGEWLWVHCVLQVKDNMENTQQPVIVCTNQVLSEREAAVMRANNWLYHYYMVQSKLQYGLAYEAHAASRMAAAYYHSHTPQPHPQVMSPYPHAQHHDPGIGVTHPHNYIQHSQHQMSSPHHVQHTGSLNGSTMSHHAPSPNTNYRYGRHTEPEPVDYSLHSSQQHLPVEEVRTPPSNKRKTVGGKLELLKSPSSLSPRSSPTSEVIVDLDRGGGGVNSGGNIGEGGPMLLTATPVATAMQHSISRPRILIKAAAIDSMEMMDQWNPSPPWSDTTVQKVPDILHQDLSPYMTTTPPTPTGTPGSLHGGSLSHQSPYSAFSFDWTPEQYVPNLCTTRSLTSGSSVDDDQYILGGSSWPPEHRLFPLQMPPVPKLVPIPALVRSDSDTTDHSPTRETRDSGSL